MAHNGRLQRFHRPQILPRIWMVCRPCTPLRWSLGVDDSRPNDGDVVFERIPDEYHVLTVGRSIATTDETEREEIASPIEKGA